MTVREFLKLARVGANVEIVTKIPEVAGGEELTLYHGWSKDIPSDATFLDEEVTGWDLYPVTDLGEYEDTVVALYI